MNKIKDDKQKRSMAVVLGIAAASVIAAACFTVTMAGRDHYTEIITNEVPAVAIETKDVVIETKGNPFAGRYVTYEGITGIETNGATVLANPSDNGDDIYIEFVVSENGDTLYSSDLVPSGKGLDVDFTKFLSGGEHEVVVTMNPYLLCDGEYKLFENKAYVLGGMYAVLSVCCCFFGVLLGKSWLQSLDNPKLYF